MSSVRVQTRNFCERSKVPACDSYPLHRDAWIIDCDVLPIWMDVGIDSTDYTTAGIPLNTPQRRLQHEVQYQRDLANVKWHSRRHLKYVEQGDHVQNQLSLAP